MRNKDISKLIRYIIVGGSAAMLNWSIFYVLNMLNIHYMLCGILAFIIATLWNFILARRFIFTPRHHIFKEAIIIYIVSFVGLALDSGILFISIEYLALDKMPSKILASFVAFIFNFSIRHFIVYKDS